MNKVRATLLDFKRRLSDRHMYSIVIVVTAIIATVAIYQYKRSLDFQTQVVNGYNRAFSELADNVNSIDNTLVKIMLVKTPAQISELSADLWRKASFAQANLGQLPLSTTELDNTGRFLAQVGDYTYALSKKLAQDQQLTQKEKDELKRLSQYASNLNNSLQDMESTLLSGAIRFDDIQRGGGEIFGSKETSVSTGFSTAEQEFADYPILVYDGPFSDHFDREVPAMLEGQPDIDQNQAHQIAVDFLGKKAQSVEFITQVEGKIPAYSFKAITTEKGREISIEITRQAGHVLLVLDNKMPTDEKIPMEEVPDIAKKFLDSKGFSSMKDTGFTRDGNCVTVNFAHVQDGVLMFRDLIKVTVALDSGEITSYEAKGYITNHRIRTIPAPVITQEQAISIVNSELVVENVSISAIPLDSGKEAFCYQIRGKFLDRDVLVYVNTQTGHEERVLIVLKSPDAMLTI